MVVCSARRTKSLKRTKTRFLDPCSAEIRRNRKNRFQYPTFQPLVPLLQPHYLAPQNLQNQWACHLAHRQRHPASTRLLGTRSMWNEQCTA